MQLRHESANLLISKPRNSRSIDGMNIRQWPTYGALANLYRLGKKPLLYGVVNRGMAPMASLFQYRLNPKNFHSAPTHVDEFKFFAQMTLNATRFPGHEKSR